MALAVAQDLLASRPDALERAHWTLLPDCRARQRGSGPVRADGTTSSPTCATAINAPRSPRPARLQPTETQCRPVRKLSAPRDWHAERSCCRRIGCWLRPNGVAEVRARESQLTKDRRRELRFAVRRGRLATPTDGMSRLQMGSDGDPRRWRTDHRGRRTPLFAERRGLWNCSAPVVAGRLMSGSGSPASESTGTTFLHSGERRLTGTSWNAGTSDQTTLENAQISQ